MKKTLCKNCDAFNRQNKALEMQVRESKRTSPVYVESLENKIKDLRSYREGQDAVIRSLEKQMLLKAATIQRLEKGLRGMY
jgi:hypothetical protein